MIFCGKTWVGSIGRSVKFHFIHSHRIELTQFHPAFLIYFMEEAFSIKGSRRSDRLSAEPPYPLDLLQDQSAIYRRLLGYLSLKYAHPVMKPVPEISDYPQHLYHIVCEEIRDHCGHEYRLLLRNRFWSQTPPSFPFADYMKRIQESMPKLETTVLLSIPIYARRLEHYLRESMREGHYPPHGLLLGPNLMHRFLIAAICLASKALGDQFYSNAYCSAVGGISPKELHCLELELAARIGWDLQCTPEEYAWSWRELCTCVP